MALLAGLCLLFYSVIDGGYFAGSGIVFGGIWVFAGVLWFTVWRMLRRRRGRVFCMVNGVLILPLFIPIGTAMGIYTLILLSRQEVINVFISAGESRASRE